LQSGEAELFLSPVSVWESLLLAERGRVVLNPDPHRWLRKAMSISPVTEVPLTIDVAIAIRAVDLEHQDPADRFIAATAKAHSLTPVTADTRLLRCSDIDLLPGH